MRSCNGCKECCYTYTVPEMEKPRLQWCKHVCEAGCAIHNGSRPDICTQFHCYWTMSAWGEDLRPDRCGAIFRQQMQIATSLGNHRLVLVADLRDRYADLRRTLSRHLDRLYNCGHIVFVTYTAAAREDDRRYWRFQQGLYPGVTEKKLMNAFFENNAATLAKHREFYARHCAGAGYEA